MNRFLKGSLPLLILISATHLYAQPKERLLPFPLSDVRLAAGPFYEAQQTDLKYILELDVDKLLAPFLVDAGLPTTVPGYGNWENTGLNGHIGGHYLSALALMYASTGDKEAKQRLDYMVDKLEQCQKKNGNGYVGGIPGGKEAWAGIQQGKIKAESFSLNDRWVPLYNIHKLYAGLRDAWQLAGNDNARMVFLKLCDWFIDMTQSLNDEQVQQMLRSEHGGMNEVFADAYEITGDMKYLTEAIRLSHRAILDPLLAAQDKLTGLHANTQIPKVIGYKKIADLNRDSTWSKAADFFWQTVVSNRTVSIGGNSVREHFHPANDFSSMIESNQGPETCNTYNMLRLTRALFLTEPEAGYIDYYERAMFNHILSSQRPTGGFVYFTPMRPQHYRVYSSPQESFWCCVGSGIENHGKYGELIYAHNDKDLYVNLFVASSLEWEEKGLTLNQQTSFPEEEKTSIHLQLKKPQRFRIYVRHPGWVSQEDFKVYINKKLVKRGSSPASYFVLDQTWKTGDVITISLPMRTKAERLPDQSSWVSFVHGPIVLAAPTDTTDLKGLVADDSRMGHVAHGKMISIASTPVVLTAGSNEKVELKPVPGKALTFSLGTLSHPQFKYNELIPFYKIHNSRYIIYWPIASKEQFEKSSSMTNQNEQAEIDRMARVVDHVVAGEQQPEVEHNYKGEQTETGSTDGRTWRRSKQWFSYKFQNKNLEGKTLRVIFEPESENINFDLLINDRTAKPSQVHKSENGTASVDFSIPEATTETVVVTIRAHQHQSTEKVRQIILVK